LTAIGKESNPSSSPFVKRGKSYPSLWKREVGRDFPREMHVPENVKLPAYKAGLAGHVSANSRLEPNLEKLRGILGRLF
jgi:hypothetical protein